MRMKNYLNNQLNENKIYKEIMSQINTKDKFAFNSWRAKGFVDMSDGLKFTVFCPKFKGYVYIKYNKSQDLYDIIFGKVMKLQFKVVKELKNISNDNLVMSINSVVG